MQNRLKNWGRDPGEINEDRKALGALLAGAAFIAGNAFAQQYPTKSIRMIVPFAEGGASGLVSRRPDRGEDAQSAGFHRVAAITSPTYPTRPIRLIVPFAPGGRRT